MIRAWPPASALCVSYRRGRPNSARCSATATSVFSFPWRSTQIARCTWSRCPDVGMCHVYRDGAGGYKSECWGCETGADKVYVEGSVCESSTDAGSEDQEDCTTREAWSDAKRRWCCVEKNLGCPDCPASSPVRCPADSRMAGTCVASDADCSSDGAEGTVVKRCRWSQCAGGVCYVY